MNDATQNELLSAYLDGTLNPAERAEVEELLKADPEARQLLDKMRALSETLKSMPRQKLGLDLSETVIKLGRQRMVTDPTDAQTPAVPLSKTILRRLKNPRMWIWEIAIAAVAVLLLIFNPSQNFPPAKHAQRQIAMAPKPPAGQSRAEEAPSIQATPQKLAFDADKSDVSKKAPAGASDSVTQLGIESKEQQTAKDASAASNGGTTRYEINPEKSDSVVSGRGSMRSGVANKQPGDMPASGARFASDNTPQPAGSPVLKPAGPPSSKPVENQTLDREQIDTLSNGQLLVITCEITPAALKNHAFDKLLADSSIVLSESPTDKKPEKDAFKADARQPSLNTYGGNADNGRLADQLVIQGQAKGLGKKNESLKSESVEIIYAEASKAQIDAMLSGMSVQNFAFKTVSVAPVTIGAQLIDDLQLQGSARLNRRGAVLKGGRDVLQKTEEAQGSEKLAQSASSNDMPGAQNLNLGYAERIPYSFESDNALNSALQNSGDNQNIADLAQKALSRSLANNPAPPRSAVGEVRGYGFGGRGGSSGGDGGSGYKPGGPAGQQSALGERLQPQIETSSGGQATTATAAAPPASPMPAGSAVPANQKQASQMSQKVKSDDLQTRTYGSARFESVATQQTQRVLFILQVAGQNNSSTSAGAATPAVAEGQQSPAEAKPAQIPPADAKPAQ